jgi:hypothetical protein
VWNVDCAPVSGALVLNTKVAIVGKGMVQTLERREAFASRAEGNNKGRR